MVLRRRIEVRRRTGVRWRTRALRWARVLRRRARSLPLWCYLVMLLIMLLRGPILVEFVLVAAIDVAALISVVILVISSIAWVASSRR